MRAVAADFEVEVVEVLVSLMRTSDDDRTRLVAAKELLDRAYGRPGQADPPPQVATTMVMRWATADDQEQSE